MLLILILILFINNLALEQGKFEMPDDNSPIKTFLRNIAQVESSGGTNMNHPEMQSGIHAGDSAIGRYGLMPNTVKEVINRMRIHGQMTPEIEQLSQMDNQTLKDVLETNPDIEDQIAETLANRVLSRQGDEEKAAYSWNQGHNLKPEQLDTIPYKESDYVRKYNTYKKLKETK